MRGNSHVRCEVGEKLEITSNTYLSLYIENITLTSQFVKKNIKEPKIELLPYHMLGIDKYKNLGLDDYIYKYDIPNNKTLKKLEGVVNNCGVEVIKYK